MGRSPGTGDHFDWETDGNAWRFEVMDMDEHRVDRVFAVKTGAAKKSVAAAS